jgi:hypothetical protein
MQNDNQKLAYSIDNVKKLTGIGRSLVFEEIKAGHLLVRKIGRRTIVLHTDLSAWLSSLPDKRSGDSRQKIKHQTTK